MGVRAAETMTASGTVRHPFAAYRATVRLHPETCHLRASFPRTQRTEIAADL
jgi:hypothetical protein